MAARNACFSLCFLLDFPHDIADCHSINACLINISPAVAVQIFVEWLISLLVHGEGRRGFDASDACIAIHMVFIRVRLICSRVWEGVLLFLGVL